MNLPVVHLSAKRNSLHPWIYKRMVRKPKRYTAPGSLVEVRSREGEFLGRGIYNGQSDIAIRVLTEDPAEQLDEAFFVDRLTRAKALREDVLKLSGRTNAYRLIHGEADGLSGLIVDKFADVLVMRIYSAGYVRAADTVASALSTVYPDARVIARSDETTARREDFKLEVLQKRFKPVGRVVVSEDEMSFEVDVDTGHKTGFFLDQRDNRQLFAQLVAGKTVCDCFCYTGGFGIASALAGASEVTGIDLDEKALDVARANAKRNGTSVDFVHRDVFDYLRSLQTQSKSVDALVLDPAKLASVKDEAGRARKTYGDLNRLGMSVIKDGGILLTCSCSGLLSERDFISVVSRSASEAGVHLQIFRIAGAAPDHPVMSTFPEGRYLKAIFARVLRKGFPAARQLRVDSRRADEPRPQR